MISENPAYKTVRKMLEELESGKRFTSRLKGRCFHEAFFDDLERLISGQSGSMSSRPGMSVHHVAIEDSKVIALPVTRRYPLAIAASISLLIVALYFSVRLFLPNDVQTGYGEYKVVELPDHSRITLNTSSSVTYNPVSWYWSRKVELSGEAFFEVEKGSDFVVKTTRGEVAVLGTSFNIKERDGEFEVRCKTGKVRVDVGSDQAILIPNEIVEFNESDGKLVKLSNESKSVATWKDGYFHFDAKPLTLVVAELERQYGVAIKINNQDDYLFTGYFPIKDLNNSLETVCSALGLSYKDVGSDSNQTRRYVIE